MCSSHRGEVVRNVLIQKQKTRSSQAIRRVINGIETATDVKIRGGNVVGSLKANDGF